MARLPTNVITSPPAPGTRIEVRGEPWLVRAHVPGISGGWGVRCVGTGGIVKGYEAVFLNTLDVIKEIRPEDTVLVSDSSPGFTRSKLFIDALSRRTPPTDDLIHLGHRGAFDPSDFQLRPAELALAALRPSILIADGVGIGKTIEAGILMAELIQRGRGERILVLAIRSVLEQFQREMWTRFAIPLVRLDSENISRIRTKIPASKNPFHVYNRCIVSVDTLKNDGRYRTYLEQCRWDIVVIDECHKLANEGSMRGRLADLLASRTDAMILTSATPHNGKPESFARLMNMLDPTAVADEKDYTQQDVAGLFVRRFKKDIQAGENFKEREIESQTVPATKPEAAILKHIQQLSFKTLDYKRKGRDVFFRYTLMKAFLSSAEACLETLENRLSRIEEQMLSNPANRQRLADDQAKLSLLLSAVDPLTQSAGSKAGALISYLKRIGVGPRDSVRVIVFAERRVTLEALKELIKKNLKMNDEQVRVFHAGLSDQEQMDVVDAFGREDSPIRVLVAGDVASEGVNLHFFCNHLVHYDIPWSPIVIEQRNGRIDRYGQKNTPHIVYLLTKTEDPKIDSDLRIYAKLIEKDEYIQKNLGDPAALLKLNDPEEEAEEIQFLLSLEEDLPDVPVAPPADSFDFMQLLGDAALSNPTHLPVERKHLISDDFEFFRQALTLGAEHESLNAEFENGTVTFTPPADLNAILINRLPTEALPTSGEYVLTSSRQLVQKAIVRARSQGGANNATKSWPHLQLLWDLHPVFEWAVDKTLISFERNEAPIIQVTGIKAQGAYVFQATMATPNGKVGLTSWFSVLLTGNGFKIQAWQDTIQECGLDRQLPNFGQGIERNPWAEKLREAVREAEKHCKHLRAEQLAANKSRVDAATKRMKDWRDRSLQALNQREIGARRTNAGNLNRRVEEQLKHSRDTVLKRFAEHERFVKESLDLVDSPSLRLVAVLVDAQDGGAR